MILSLFIVFLLFTLIIIAIGLFRPDHTEISLIGFLFLFLLSIVILNGEIQYKTGQNYTYSCLCCNGEETQRTGEASYCDGENATLVVTQTIDNYATWESGGTFSHIVGYWLSVASIVGFIGVILSLRHSRGFK